MEGNEQERGSICVFSSKTQIVEMRMRVGAVVSQWYLQPSRLQSSAPLCEHELS
jgi:hypothetical protein